MNDSNMLSGKPRVYRITAPPSFFMIRSAATGMIILVLTLFFAFMATPETFSAAVQDRMTFRIRSTEPGETLERIAAESHIYNDPLKWTLIYYFNRQELSFLSVDIRKLPVHPLPGNMLLAVLISSSGKTVDQASPHWAVNVVSVVQRHQANKLVIDLINDGYFVYFTAFEHKGKLWNRVRVGFFDTRESADFHKERIVDRHGIDGSWTVKVTDEELEEFLPFFEQGEIE